MPKGSIRALVALVMAVCCWVPMTLSSVITFYYGSRS